MRIHQFRKCLPIFSPFVKLRTLLSQTSSRQGYYCAPEHERLASAAAAAALAALSQGSAAACKAVLAEDDSITLLAYPLAVGCASVAAVKQETEAVLQVRLASAAGLQMSRQVVLASTFVVPAPGRSGQQ